MKKSPAEYVIHIFGGVRPLARLIDRHPSSVAAWKRSSENRGGGGFVPVRLHADLLKLAAKKKLDLTSDHLIYGGKITKRKG